LYGGHSAGRKPRISFGYILHANQAYRRCSILYVLCGFRVGLQDGGCLAYREQRKDNFNLGEKTHGRAFKMGEYSAP
jgi:hypothetical protein